MNPHSHLLVRHIHVGYRCLDKEPAKASSKVEETVNLLKGQAKDEAEAKDKETQLVPKKKPLTTRIMDELKHYYHGFRLLFVDINISRKLAMKALRGETLTRREHRLVSLHWWVCYFTSPFVTSVGNHISNFTVGANHR